MCCCAISRWTAIARSWKSRLGLPALRRAVRALHARQRSAGRRCVDSLSIQNVRFREIAGFAVLVSRSRQMFDRSRAGGRQRLAQSAGRNNTTGGILLEEGTQDFRVTRCELRNIRGNGIWTHSLYTSPRNARGVFAENRFDTIGRDALQAGHATEMRWKAIAARESAIPQDIGGRAHPGGHRHRGQRGPLDLHAQSVFSASTASASTSMAFTMARSAATSAWRSADSASS